MKYGFLADLIHDKSQCLAGKDLSWLHENGLMFRDIFFALEQCTLLSGLVGIRKQSNHSSHMKLQSIFVMALAAGLAFACADQSQKETAQADQPEEKPQAEATASKGMEGEMTPEQIFEQDFAEATIEDEAGTPAEAPEGATMVSLDPEASTIMWRGYKIGATGAHYGTLSLKESQLAMADGMPQAGKVLIDMTSIQNKDISEPDKVKKLEGHLKSEEFFNVAEYPEAMIEITGIKSMGDNMASIHGNLTIKGITHEIMFPATVMMKDGQMMAKAMFTFDRAKYNVKWGSKSFPELLGDVIVSDDIQLYLDLKSKPVKEETTAMSY